MISNTVNITDVSRRIFMVDAQNKIVLATLETLFQLQLRSVKQLLGEDDIEVTMSRRTGMRRQSLVNLSVQLLTQEQRALHVNEIISLLRERYGRITDRDALSSALAKKARQGILVHQTGPAMFALRDPVLKKKRVQK